MTLRSILVPVRGDGLGEGVLNHALALARRSDAHLDVVHCRPRPEDRSGQDYDSAGRVDGALLAGLAPGPDAHYLLCGPTAFMAEIQSALEAGGVPAEFIHAESFGPKG